MGLIEHYPFVPRYNFWKKILGSKSLEAINFDYLSKNSDTAKVLLR